MDTQALRAETLRRFALWELPANEHLPLIETEDELRPQPPSSVAKRAVAASYVIGLCFGADFEATRKHLETFDLWQSLAQSERDFIERAFLSEQDKSIFGWLVESVQFLAWALRLAELDHFRHCDDTLASLFPFKTSPGPFIQSAQLRASDEIRQESDTLYMLHWSAVESKLSGRDTRIVLPLVSYRRHAADWIIGTAAEWDEVPLDT